MKPHKFPYSYAVKCYGVPVAVHVNEPSAIGTVADVVAAALPVPYEPIEASMARHHIYYRTGKNGQDSLYGGPAGQSFKKIPHDVSLRSLESWIRLTVAEFAQDRLFVHAGVVGLNGKAIVIPGSSYSGKTTLTLELIRRGAVYYSDEYAIIDEEGFVEPYPKKLSIRGEIDAYTQIEHDIEKFGARIGQERIPISTVVLSRYVRRAHWRPRLISEGEGVLGMLEHTVSAQTNPRFALLVLTNLASNVQVVRSNRGEAKTVVDWLLNADTRQEERSGDNAAPHFEGLGLSYTV
jgi:hypothetical protein